MSAKITNEQSKCFFNSNNNNFIEALNESFKSDTFCVSSESDYISSRLTFIDGDKGSEPTTKTVKSKSIPQDNYGSNYSCKLNSSSNNPYCTPGSSGKSKIIKTVAEILDSGISSPTCNFSDHLNSVKREKSISFKEKFNDNDQSDLLPLMDSVSSKIHNSKFQFRLPKIHHAHHNSSNIGSIVNRIRSLSISMAYNSNNSSRRTSGDGSSLPSETISPSATTLDIDSDPTKLPKEYQNSSINFTNKTLRTNRKWLRMTHSLSCDAESYNVHEFSATQNRLEKYLSGHLDASTPNGALLKVINQGLRKVSESDRYLLFSKSPLRSPNDFLESGIEHLGDTEMLINVLHHSTCYDLMPESGKLVVFDSGIEIDKAFMALSDHCISSAPVWCNNNKSFCAMLTREDQIHFLSLAYELNDSKGDLETHIENLSKESIMNCIGRDPEKHELRMVYPENTVAAAIKELEHSPYNKVLVIDEQRSGNALFVLDHGHILSFLLNASKAGLPLPSVLKITVGVTELMLSRKLLNKYQVFMDTDVTTLLQVMNANPNHCALVCLKAVANNICSCNYDCIAVITVDHISHLISTSKVNDPSYTVQSILRNVTEINQKIIRCTERDSVIDIIKLMIKEKASFVLISPDCAKKCVHSIISSKELLDYITKHDRNRSSSRESVFAIDKTKCCRTISCCEDPQRTTDKNLSEVSLDEKDEDVFNMEML